MPACVKYFIVHTYKIRITFLKKSCRLIQANLLLLNTINNDGQHKKIQEI